jgi:hypothetical protein
MCRGSERDDRVAMNKRQPARRHDKATICPTRERSYGALDLAGVARVRLEPHRSPATARRPGWRPADLRPRLPWDRGMTAGPGDMRRDLSQANNGRPSRYHRTIWCTRGLSQRVRLVDDWMLPQSLANASSVRHMVRTFEGTVICGLGPRSLAMVAPKWPRKIASVLRVFIEESPG